LKLTVLPMVLSPVWWFQVAGLARKFTAAPMQEAAG
jgi:hypothetical protein